jgi:Holliday junction resolvase RusA-like endonuclease
VNELTLVIPIEPPSGNHYKSFRVIGKHACWYLTKEAKAWHAAVQSEACWDYPVGGFSPIEGNAHEITYTVYQGSGSRGDVDNYAKCILDSLVKAGVLKSDASVVSLHAHKMRDRQNPRTEIHIRSIERKVA